MNNLNDYLSILIDYTTLVYHEARNVRHLLRAHHIEPNDWKYLIALPVNRNKAWEALQDTPRAAKQAESVKLPYFNLTTGSRLRLTNYKYSMKIQDGIMLRMGEINGKTLLN